MQTDVKLLTNPTFSSLCWFNPDILAFYASVSFSCIPSPTYDVKITILNVKPSYNSDQRLLAVDSRYLESQGTLLNT